MQRFVLWGLLSWTLLASCVPQRSTAPDVNLAINKAPVYTQYLDKGEKYTSISYQHMISRTREGLYVKRTFYPEKNQVTRLITFKSKDLKIAHGPAKSWTDDGTLIVEEHYTDGYLNGSAKYYFRTSGRLFRSGQYVVGREDGLWQVYHADGRVHYEYTKKAGQLDGPFIIYGATDTVLNQGKYQAGALLEQTQTTPDLTQLSRQDEQGNWLKPDEMPHLREVSHIKDAAKRQSASDKKLLEFVDGQVAYPEDARLHQVEGMAVISFVINEDGTVGDIEVVRGICQSIEKECLRILQDLPAWNPGRVDGQPVSVKSLLPVRFRLE